jgi:hypothetical protein
VTDPVTVGDRISVAGVAPERVAEHMRAGRVRLDGQPVTDLDMPAPWPSRTALHDPR